MNDTATLIMEYSLAAMAAGMGAVALVGATLFLAVAVKLVIKEHFSD